MNIPEKVRVAGYTYEVQRPEGSFVDGTTACDGIHTPHETVIKVAQRGNAAYQNTVFLHELIHAIDYAYCGGEQEEKFVEQFAKGLYKVITDNPEIFKIQ